MSHKLTSNNSSPTNSSGIPKILLFLDSELPSEGTDPQVFALLMTINKLLLNMNPPTGWEDWKFSLKETPRENLRNNWKEKSRNLEEEKEEKC